MPGELNEAERQRVRLADSPPLLELRCVSKSYGPIHALTDVDFTVDAGTVTALVGDNGAGKSTLVKAIAGAHQLTAGEILVDGDPVTIGSPAESARLGIETVYQDLALCDNLDVVANLYLGREARIGRLPLLDKLRMERESGKVINDLSASIPNLSLPVASLSGGQRQAIAVARASLWGSRVVLLDEPTAALGVAQTQTVYDLVRRMRSTGLGVVVVTHNMADAFAVADRIAVLRLGRNAGIFTPATSSPDDVVAAITGSDTIDPKADHHAG